MDYGTRLERAFAELESCGGIEVERRAPNPDLTPERLALIADADLAVNRINGFWRTRLDDVLRPYCFAADEYHADWITADDRVRGEFCSWGTSTAAWSTVTCR
ncbi:hypothetical protein [Streptomyces sp. NPDC005408]|uniref:hypothetical protein n=1 Tax=Streptomyces sp. NPDC005408 TaxID=3155341 RepID=UPI0033B805A1